MSAGQLAERAAGRSCEVISAEYKEPQRRRLHRGAAPPWKPATGIRLSVKTASWEPGQLEGESRWGFILHTGSFILMAKRRLTEGVADCQTEWETKKKNHLERASCAHFHKVVNFFCLSKKLFCLIFFFFSFFFIWLFMFEHQISSGFVIACGAAPAACPHCQKGGWTRRR